MSKILDRYNSSIFANIGKKVSQIQDFKIPDSAILKTIEHKNLEMQNIPVVEVPVAGDLSKERTPVLNSPKSSQLETTGTEILPFNTQSISTKQSVDLKTPKNINLLDFSIQNIIIKPFGTLLSLNSKFGNIIVKPYQSMLRLFDSISEPRPIILGTSSKLINSPIDKIDDKVSESKLLILNSKFDDLMDMSTTSVLSFKAPSTDLMISTSVLSFKAPNPSDMILTSVLEEHSLLGITQLMKTSSVLKYFQSSLDFRTLSVITQKPTYGVIREFKTNSILNTSKVGTLIIKDIETVLLKLYDNTGIGNSVPSFVNYISDINATGFTIDATPFITLFDVTTIPSRIQSGEFIENAQLGASGFSEDNIQKISNVLETNQFTTNNTFVSSPVPKQTYFDTKKIQTELNFAIPSVIYGLPNSDNPQFRAKDASADFGRTEYDPFKVPNLFQFDFQSRNGVLNEFVNFYPDNIAVNTANSEMSFKRYLDYLIKYISFGAIAKRSDFYTPLMYLQNPNIGGRDYYPIPMEYRGYEDAEDRVPAMASQFLDFLTGATVTIGSGMATNAAMDGLKQLTGADFSIAKVSPLGLHVVAGDIYMKLNSLDSKMKILTVGSDSSAGTSLLSQIGISGEISAYAGIGVSAITALVPQSIFKNDLPEYGLMIAQILAGTKYTAAYAFYDPSADRYSSKYSVVGLNAINWYQNDGSEAQFNPDKSKYESSDRGSIDTNFRLSIANRFKRTLNDTYDGSGFADPLTNIQKTRRSVENFLKEPAGTILKTVNSNIGPRIDALLGSEYLMLKVPSLSRQDSFTFGKFEEFFTTVDSHYWGGYKDSILNPKSGQFVGPIVDSPLISPTVDTELTSLKTNYSKDDKNNLNKYVDSSGLNVISPFIEIKGTNVPGTYPIGGYSDKLRQKIKSTKAKTLDQYGIPDINENEYVDSKNASDLVVIAKNTAVEDNDLIDFYFEDVTSTADENIIVIPFRALITSYSDSTSANWQTNTYVGRPDKFYIYGGYDRKISLSFQVSVNSRTELLSSWRKINYLQGMCYPVAYPHSISMTAPILALTVGALVQRVHVIMNSISLDFDNATLWEIEKGTDDSGKKVNYQVPMSVKINTDLNVLYDSIPIATARHFAQKENWIDPFVYDGISGQFGQTPERIQRAQRKPMEINVNSGQLKNFNK